MKFSRRQLFALIFSSFFTSNKKPFTNSFYSKNVLKKLGNKFRFKISNCTYPLSKGDKIYVNFSKF